MLLPFYYKPAKIYLTPKPLIPLSLLRRFVQVVVRGFKFVKPV